LRDIIIIGHGPAGVSAAIYAARAGANVLLAGKDFGALGKTAEIENFYGHPSPVSGAALGEAGLAQARRLGVEVVQAEALDLRRDGFFTLKTDMGNFESHAAVFATGAGRVTPKIDGLAEFEGRGVSYCAVCDGFFYRGKDVAVLGSGKYALNEASDLLPVVKSVTVLTNGRESVGFPPGVKIFNETVASIRGEKRVGSVELSDGTTLTVSGLFVAEGVAGSTELARKIGAVIENGSIKVAEDKQTNVPGLFAAGDCAGGLKQIAKAVYEGMIAGIEAAKFAKQFS
jgi:thioredoxin reductase (NADPH)